MVWLEQGDHVELVREGAQGDRNEVGQIDASAARTKTQTLTKAA